MKVYRYDNIDELNGALDTLAKSGIYVKAVKIKTLPAKGKPGYVDVFYVFTAENDMGNRYKPRTERTAEDFT